MVSATDAWSLATSTEPSWRARLERLLRPILIGDIWGVGEAATRKGRAAMMVARVNFMLEEETRG